MVRAASTLGFRVLAQYCAIPALRVGHCQIVENETLVWVCLCLCVDLECVARRGFVKPDGESTSCKFMLLRCAVQQDLYQKQCAQFRGLYR